MLHLTGNRNGQSLGNFSETGKRCGEKYFHFFSGLRILIKKTKKLRNYKGT
jgi:hypothetical protein